MKVFDIICKHTDIPMYVSSYMPADEHVISVFAILIEKVLIPVNVSLPLFILSMQKLHHFLPFVHITSLVAASMRVAVPGEVIGFEFCHIFTPQEGIAILVESSTHIFLV